MLFSLQRKDTHFALALKSVPKVSAMSSTMMATLSATSPTSTMVSTSFAFFLWGRERERERGGRGGGTREKEGREGRERKMEYYEKKFKVRLASLWMSAKPMFNLSAMDVTLWYKKNSFLSLSMHNELNWGLTFLHPQRQVTPQYSPANLERSLESISKLLAQHKDCRLVCRRSPVSVTRAGPWW